MKIYVRGTFERRLELRPVKDAIWHLGHEMTSSWIDEVARPPHMTQEEFRRKLAIKDIAETIAADLLIVDTERVSGGKNVELGVALGRHQHMMVWRVGKATNVFHELVDKAFETWTDCLKHLEANYGGHTDAVHHQE